MTVCPVADGVATVPAHHCLCETPTHRLVRQRIDLRVSGTARQQSHTDHTQDKRTNHPNPIIFFSDDTSRVCFHHRDVNFLEIVDFFCVIARDRGQFGQLFEHQVPVLPHLWLEMTTKIYWAFKKAPRVGSFSTVPSVTLDRVRDPVVDRR